VSPIYFERVSALFLWYMYLAFGSLLFL